MNDKILISIKKLLGITADDISFDDILIIHINSVFSILHQMGVGPEECFKISSESTWLEFIDNEATLECVKSYVFLKVKLIFDPPLNSSILESIKQVISELEWRLNTSSDYSSIEEG